MILLPHYCDSKDFTVRHEVLSGFVRTVAALQQSMVFGGLRALNQLPSRSW